MNQAVDNGDQLSVVEKIGYGLGDTASNIVFQTVLLFITFFYTDIYGLAPAAMGTMFLAVRVLDAVTDPLMGAIADRTKTQWGRFRPYLLWLAIPFAGMSILTFTTPDLDGTAKLAYAYVTYGLLMILYTAINIPYCALGGVITSHPQQRVSLQSYRFVLASIGGVIVSALTLPLVDYFGNGDKQLGYQLAMTLMSVLGVFLFVICFATTKERVEPAVESGNTVKEDMAELIKNDQWRLLSGITFIAVIGVVARSAAGIFYITHVVGAGHLATVFITTGLVGMTLGSMFAAPLSKKICKIKLYSISSFGIAALCLAYFFIPPKAIFLAFAMHFAIGFLQQMTSPLLWAMVSDSVDYGEWKTGSRITGLAFSYYLFALKIGLALAGAIVGWLLAVYGYDGAAETQSAQAIHGISLLFCVLPAITAVIVGALMYFYKLNDATVTSLQSDLAARAAAA